MKRCLIFILIIGIITAVSGCGTGSDTGGQSGEPETVTISVDELRDKIAGGWAGKMIGVAYGAPTEFRWQGKIIDGELDWAPDWAANSFKQDDLYVQLSFMETMDDFGIDAPAEKIRGIIRDGWISTMARQRSGPQEFLRRHHATAVGQPRIQPSCR